MLDLHGTRPCRNRLPARSRRPSTQPGRRDRQGTPDLWDLEHYLTERRKDIDRKYDYRDSRLTRVFGRLLYEGRVSEEELRGLCEDKLKSIRSLADFFAKYAD